MRQPTIYSHPMSQETCVACGHENGHPAGDWDPDGFCRVCHCGHPEWDPERDGAVGGQLGVDLRMEINRLGSIKRWQDDPDQTYVRMPTAQEIECVRYELAADKRTPEQKKANEDAYWERYGDILPPCLSNGPGAPCRCGCGQERNDAVRLLGILRARAKMGDSHITRSGSVHKSHRMGRR